MFPVDWNEWRKEWLAWRADHADQLKPCRNRFPGKNFLADEKLGTWWVNGRDVELSEVTFPNLSKRDPQTGRLLEGHVRMVGVTWAVGEPNGGTVVDSFSELERVLGI